MRDGFTFEPIDVEVHPEERGKYRILDGVHRWHAYKAFGTNEIEAHIVRLDGCDPLLYAAKKASPAQDPYYNVWQCNPYPVPGRAKC